MLLDNVVMRDEAAAGLALQPPLHAMHLTPATKSSAISHQITENELEKVSDYVHVTALNYC